MAFAIQICLVRLSLQIFIHLQFKYAHIMNKWDFTFLTAFVQKMILQLCVALLCFAVLLNNK